jgi:hypothetical protein
MTSRRLRRATSRGPERSSSERISQRFTQNTPSGSVRSASTFGLSAAAGSSSESNACHRESTHGVIRPSLIASCTSSASS